MAVLSLNVAANFRPFGCNLVASYLYLTVRVQIFLCVSFHLVHTGRKNPSSGNCWHWEEDRRKEERNWQKHIWGGVKKKQPNCFLFINLISQQNSWHLFLFWVLSFLSYQAFEDLSKLMVKVKNCFLLTSFWHKSIFCIWSMAAVA